MMLNVCLVTMIVVNGAAKLLLKEKTIKHDVLKMFEKSNIKKFQIDIDKGIDKTIYTSNINYYGIRFVHTLVLLWR